MTTDDSNIGQPRSRAGLDPLGVLAGTTDETGHALGTDVHTRLACRLTEWYKPVPKVREPRGLECELVNRLDRPILRMHPTLAATLHLIRVMCVIPVGNRRLEEPAAIQISLTMIMRWTPKWSATHAAGTLVIGTASG